MLMTPNKVIQAVKLLLSYNTKLIEVAVDNLMTSASLEIDGSLRYKRNLKILPALVVYVY